MNRGLPTELWLDFLAIRLNSKKAAGKASKINLVTRGNREVYEQLKRMIVHFDLAFELMPGTDAKDLTPEENPFEQEGLADTAGG
jgi:hypothetical protein